MYVCIFTSIIVVISIVIFNSIAGFTIFTIVSLTLPFYVKEIEGTLVVLA
jgi:hypothetical protein